MNTISNVNPSRFPSVGEKPSDEINAIFDKAKPFCEMIVLDEGSTVEFSNLHDGYCFFVVDGHISMHRKGDGIIVCSESSPHIFGVSNYLQQYKDSYLRSQCNSTLFKIPCNTLNKVIVDGDLWEQLAKFLVYSTSRIYESYIRIQKMPAYEIVCFHLLQLIKEDERLRASTTVSTYIAERTCLSRSRIMYILSALREGRYIKMEKGRLTFVNHLPQKF